MEAISAETLRIIDANLNRTGEGLRFIEEVARLALNDADLSQRLKDMRHGLLRYGLLIQRQLIQARDSEGDVGADMVVSGEKTQRGMHDAVVANSRRVQESLRVLEEIARDPAVALDTDTFKKARFGLYSIEKELLSKVLRRDKTEKLRGLYVIVDTDSLRKRSHLEVAKLAIEGGARVIQLRDKEHYERELLAIAQGLKDLCFEKEVLFIVNDYIEIAVAAGADGVHVGSEDLPAGVARRLLPIDKMLGCSVQTVEQALMAQSEGADYVAVGAVFPSPTKPGADPVGTARIKEIKEAVSVPVVAIGGISEKNAGEVFKAGADAVAIASAVLGEADVAAASRRIVDVIKGRKDHG